MKPTNGLLDLLASERGVLAIMLVIVTGALVFTGRMTTEQWIEFNKWIGTVLIASKTVTTAIETMRQPQVPPATANERPPNP